MAKSINKTVRSLFKNKLSCFVYLIFFLGLILRAYTIFTQEIFVDEILYFEAARTNLFTSLITLNYLIKDHGFLYPIFLKVLQFLTYNIFYLRLSNLIFFFLSYVFLYKFFQKFQNNWHILIPLTTYSFLPYFVYLNTYISPYNFSLFFSIFSFISISSFILFSKTKEDKFKNGTLFIIFSTLSFYSDYSIVYFYLALAPVLLLLFKWSERLGEDLGLLGIINLIFIAPGLYQLVNNFKYFYGLNNSLRNINYDPVSFLNVFSGIYLNIDNNNFSLFVLVLLVFSILILFLSTKDRKIKFLSFFYLSGISTGLLFLYTFNISYFYIFTERTFWFFYFLFLIGVAVFAFHINKNKKTSLIFVFCLIMIFFFKYSQLSNLDPISGTIFENKKLVGKLITSKEYLGEGEIVYFDKSFNYEILSNYYLRPSLNTNGKDINSLVDFLRFKDTYVIRASREIDNISISNDDKIIFIVTDFNSTNIANDIKSELKKIQLERKISFETYIFNLRCYRNDCFFYKYK